MYEDDNENEFVTLNFEALSKNAAVWEVMKEEMKNLSGECMMKIITAAKVQGLKDKDIFLPIVELVDVEYSDPFGDSVEDESEED